MAGGGENSLGIDRLHGGQPVILAHGAAITTGQIGLGDGSAKHRGHANPQVTHVLRSIPDIATVI